MSESICDRGATQPPAHFHRNPPGRASFGRLLCRSSCQNTRRRRYTSHGLGALGMQLVGGTPADTPGLGASAFLTSRPGEESHEIALFSQPQFRHVAFKVASLAELKRMHRLVLERELPIKLISDHGASLAFYFDDPDGNMIEVYWPTGRHVKQPCLKPLDLNQSDEAILASIATETVLPLEIPL